MSNARLLVANPTASTESKILDVMSSAVTRMPQRNVDGISVNSQDANSPKDSQEKIIMTGTCDSMITLSNNDQEDFAEPAVPADKLLNKPQWILFYYAGPNRTIIEFLNSPTLVLPAKITKIQEDLSLSEDREISAMNWTDRCSPEWRLYNSEHPHGGCRFSEPSMLLSITGVQPRKLRIKDWQNAHGKVGIIDCQCYLRSKKIPPVQENSASTMVSIATSIF